MTLARIYLPTCFADLSPRDEVVHVDIKGRIRTDPYVLPNFYGHAMTGFFFSFFFFFYVAPICHPVTSGSEAGLHNVPPNGITRFSNPSRCSEWKDERRKRENRFNYRRLAPVTDGHGRRLPVWSTGTICCDCTGLAEVAEEAE